MSSKRTNEIVRAEFDHTASRQEVSSRLALMPLAVLLPKIGDLRQVAQGSDLFASRLAEIQSQNLSGVMEDEDAESVKRRSLEESMLNQVLQWLSIQEA